MRGAKYIDLYGSVEVINLPVKSHETLIYTPNLSAVLSHIPMLGEIKGVSPTTHLTGLNESNFNCPNTPVVNPKYGLTKDLEK